MKYFVGILVCAIIGAFLQSSIAFDGLRETTVSNLNVLQLINIVCLTVFSYLAGFSIASSEKSEIINTLRDQLKKK